MKKAVVIVAALVLALVAGYVVLRSVSSPEGAGDAGSSGAPPPATRVEARPTAPAAQASPGGPTLATTTREAHTTAETLQYASGVVVDRGGQPVPGVAVISRATQVLRQGSAQDQGFEFQQDLAHPTTRTDAEGRFNVAKAMKDQVSLVFLKDGFAAAEYRGLDPDAAKNQGIRVVLDPGKRLVLTVKDTDGRPIEGARLIFWFKQDALRHTLFGGHTTDAEGRCVVGWLAGGDSPISQLHVGGYAYKDKTLHGTEIHEEETVVLERKFPIVVVMTAASGRPVDGAAGVLHAAEPGGAYVCVLTATPMPYAWAVSVPGILAPTPWPPSGGGHEVKEGAYRASVFATGFKPAEASFRVSAGTEPPRVEIPMAAGDAPISLAGTLEPAGIPFLEIRMAMPQGWGSEGDRSLPLVLTVPVSEAGAFTVRGLPDGPYRLIASGAGRAPLGVDVTAPAENLRLRIEPEAVLDVRVLGEDGAPVAKRWVTVAVDGVRLAWEAATGADGIARFEGLPAGTAHALPFLAQGSAVASMPPHATTRLTAGDRKTLDVKIPARVPTTLRVKDETGAPVSGITLTAQIRGGWSLMAEGEWERMKRWTATTASDGTARVDLYEGQYEATATRGASQRATNIKVGAEPSVVDLAWTTLGGGVFGRVAEAGGAPVAGRPIYVFSDDPQSGGRIGQTVTDADGRYEVGGLPAQALSIRFALNRARDGQGDKDSPFPTINWKVTPAAGKRLEHDVLVPRVRGEGAEEPTVDASLLVLEDGTRAALGEVTASTEALRGDSWIQTTDMKTGPDGRATGRLLRGERYRFMLYRYVSSVKTHLRKEVEAAPIRGRIDVEATLERAPAPVR